MTVTVVLYCIDYMKDTGQHLFLERMITYNEEQGTLVT